MLVFDLRCRSLTAIALLSLLLTSCSSLLPSRQDFGQSPTLGKASAYIEATADLSGILPELSHYRVVLVGEQHDRLDHHVIQLDIIKYLHSLGLSVAIGLEFFQQPYQAVLDDFVAGVISEQEMLRETGYFKRWGYDYRLYAPVLRFARAEKIPLVALNLPGEIIRKTSREGLLSLDAQARQYVPDIDYSVEGYRERISESYAAHGDLTLAKLENFIDAQLLWDEGMAQRAADYLFEHPEQLLIILAGAGHIEYRTGIPVRLERRIHSPVVTVLPVAIDAVADLARADYLVRTKEFKLPPAGLMGVALGKSKKGVFAESFPDNSAAKAAGLKAGDILRSINGQRVEDYIDVKLALWDAKPGQAVDISVERQTAGSPDALQFRPTLR